MDIIKNEFYIFISMIIITGVLLFENITGLFISIIAFFTSWYMRFSDNYSYATLFKIYLVIIPTIILFLNLNNLIKMKDINFFLRISTQLNILALVFTENNFLIICSLLLSVLTTPYFILKNNKITMKPNIINTSIWVIMTAIILTFNYTTYSGWNEHKYIALFCIWVPTITYFLFNRYLSVRGLLLCCWFLFDLIDKKNKGF